MSDTRGFTLIEVLLAGAMIAVALIGMAGMMITAHGTLDRSGEQTAATVLVQQRLEWLRNQAYASGSLTAGTTTETLTGTYVGYTRVTTIVNDTPRTGVKRVTVQVQAPSGLNVQAVSLRASP